MAKWEREPDLYVYVIGGNEGETRNGKKLRTCKRQPGAKKRPE